MIIEGHTNTYHGYTLEEALAGIAEAGYEWADLTAVPGWSDFVQPDSDVESVRAMLDGHGLKCTSMSAHLDVWSKESWDYLTALVDWSGRFGIRWLSCALADDADKPREVEVAESFRALVDRANALGVTVCVETHGVPWRNGVAILDFLADSGASGAGINYDTGNVEFYGGGMAVDDLPGVLDAVHHLHLKDHLGGEGHWAFPPLGGGHVDFAAILAILARSERQLHASVELEFFGDPFPALPIVTDAMRVSLEHLKHVGS